MENVLIIFYQGSACWGFVMLLISPGLQLAIWIDKMSEETLRCGEAIIPPD